MATKTLTMHELLVAIKMTKKKLQSIEDASTNGMSMITLAEVSADVTDATAILKSNYQSRMALIANLEEYEKVRTITNATTTFKVGGREMTISDAIKEKENLRWKKSLLTRMKYEFSNVQRMLTKEMNDLKNKVEKAYPIGSESTPEVIDAMTKAREAEIEKHKMQLVDPNSLEASIATLETEIEEFETAVDAALSYINAVTTVTVNLAD